MWNFLTGIFQPVTDIAKELIDTPLEKAQAQVLKLKALDPNGKMRREISRAVARMYQVYIYTAMILLLAQAFDLGDKEQVALAIKSIVDLFVPITAMFTAIVSASFGVQVGNTMKEKREIEVKGNA